MSLVNAPMSRRGFLRRSSAVAATAALPAWLLSACGGEGSDDTAIVEEEGVTTFKATHGTGLCNLPFFLTKEKAWSDKIDLAWVVAPTSADVSLLFATGEVELSVMPYTFALSLIDKGAPIKVISGSGAQGCILVSHPEITSPETLKGNSVATAQADTLELIAYNYLQQGGYTMKDVQAKYIATMQEMIEAFMSGAVKAATSVEPFASQMHNELEGANILTDGIDMYGEGYSDCLLVAAQGAIDEHRDALKEVVRSMMLSQQFAEESPDEAIALTAEKYFKNAEDVIAMALKAQPSAIEQRGNEQFILDRAQDFLDMGYIKTVPTKDQVFDWTILDEVVEENQDVYDSLKWKRA